MASRDGRRSRKGFLDILYLKKEERRTTTHLIVRPCEPEMKNRMRIFLQKEENRGPGYTRHFAAFSLNDTQMCFINFLDSYISEFCFLYISETFARERKVEERRAGGCAVCDRNGDRKIRKTTNQ